METRHLWHEVRHESGGGGSDAQITTLIINISYKILSFLHNCSEVCGVHVVYHGSAVGVLVL